jgi:hypothetical protein
MKRRIASAVTSLTLLVAGLGVISGELRDPGTSP